MEEPSPSLKEAFHSIGNRRIAIDASGLPSGLTIDANGSVTNHRVLSITNSAATVLLQSLTLTGGDTSSEGGGISSSGTLSPSDPPPSRGIRPPAPKHSAAAFTLFKEPSPSMTSTISENSSSSDTSSDTARGGGIYTYLGTISIHGLQHLRQLSDW